MNLISNLIALKLNEPGVKYINIMEGKITSVTDLVYAK